MSPTPTDAAWHIFGQLMAAFGQGAGSLPITTDAAATAAATYIEPIVGRVQEWPAIEAETLAFARALGRLSAHHALEERRPYLTGADLTWATSNIVPLLPCPMCIDPRLAPLRT
jgi:hypothetical protein